MSGEGPTDEQVEALVRKGVKGVAVAFVVVALIGLLFSATFSVDDGERAVVTRFGETQQVAEPGLNFKVPVADSVHPYETRTKAYTMSSSRGEGEDPLRDESIGALTSEGLNISVDLTVRYHNDPARMESIYQSVGTDDEDVANRIVRPTAREAVRSCSAQYPVEGIYSDQRDDFGQCVTDTVSDDFEEKGLMLETVQVRNIDLPERIREAIQNKQATQEEIEQKKNELEVEELEKERRIIESEGIAESQSIIDETLTPEYLRYLWIQEGLEKGDATYVPVGNDGLPIYKDVDSAQNATAGAQAP